MFVCLDPVHPVFHLRIILERGMEKCFQVYKACYVVTFRSAKMTKIYVFCVFCLQSGVDFTRDKSTKTSECWYILLLVPFRVLSMHLNFSYNKQGYEGKETF